MNWEGSEQVRFGAHSGLESHIACGRKVSGTGILPWGRSPPANPTDPSAVAHL